MSDTNITVTPNNNKNNISLCCFCNSTNENCDCLKFIDCSAVYLRKKSPGYVEMSGIKTYKADYEFGISSEKQNLETIKKCFNININNDACKNRYDNFDFKSSCDNVWIELKTRTNKHDQFETTIIPKSKIDYAISNPQRTYYFVFAFTDGLYYIEYNKELFDTFEVKEFVRFKRAGYTDKAQLYYFIPVTKLTKI